MSWESELEAARREIEEEQHRGSLEHQQENPNLLQKFELRLVEVVARSEDLLSALAAYYEVNISDIEVTSVYAGFAIVINKECTEEGDTDIPWSEPTTYNPTIVLHWENWSVGVLCNGRLTGNRPISVGDLIKKIAGNVARRNH